jgi:hypothetical protein
MVDYRQIYHDFVSPAKSLLIAPAGYGKTHTIAECLKFLKENNSIENQLVLTHTHAGIASIKEKIQKVCPSCRYNIETISSFAQKYVEAFYCGTIPEQDHQEYFPFLINKAATLFKLRPITEVVRTSYSGLFVDEYQDCTLSQHKLILALSEILPTHILGDPLQGIFGFNDEQLVDIEKDLLVFNRSELTEPWRWKNSNPKLGEWTMNLRRNLERNNSIDLSGLNNVTNSRFLLVNENDINLPDSDYRKWLTKISFNNKAINDLDNILIISPSTIWQRVDLNQHLSYRFQLLEAFDESAFYVYAKKMDLLMNSRNIYHDFITILKGKSVKVRQINGNIRKTRQSTLISGLSPYFKDDDRIPNSRKEILNPIISLIKTIVVKPEYLLIAECYNSISKLNDVHCTRKELFTEIIKSLKHAAITKTSVFEAMKEIRNVKRRVGRRLVGRFIGTTLLTKGLEFDTVVVLNAHKFTDPKNLYVALTRASKRLIVFTENEILSPYSNLRTSR